jgi:diguanylate cyclase (GGDEF)-like protein
MKSILDGRAAQWLFGILKWLVEPVRMEQARDRHLSRILNITLLTSFMGGVAFELLSRTDDRVLGEKDVYLLSILGVLGFAYYLNRRGYLRSAATLVLGLFISAIFTLTLLQYLKGARDFSILYFLMIAILVAELFLSIRAYLTITLIILGGVFAISLVNYGTQIILLFLVLFGALTSLSRYNRHLVERQQIALEGQFSHEQFLLSLEQRRSAQLGLLEQTGRKIAESLDEKEILQSTVEAVVNQFGYAEAAISLLVNENVLEVTAISGTQDYGYRPGYQQQLGAGIIGYVGKTCRTYVANNVRADPYYYSNTEHEGSAIGVPIMDEKVLIGVLYIESSGQGSFKADDIQLMQTLSSQVASSIQKARLYADAQENLRIMSTVQSISRIISSSLQLDDIFQNVVQLLKDTFGYTYVSIYLLQGDYLNLGAQSGYIEEMIFNKIHIDQGVIGYTAKTKTAQFVRDVSAEPHFLRASKNVCSEICVPLLKDDTVLGTLNVEADSKSSLTQKDLEFLKLLAGPIALAVDNARLHAEVKALAMTDAVSGLSNRHAFEETLSAEVLRAQRHGHSLSLIIFDIDLFKDYNDTWGHPAGDVRLKATAELIRTIVRKYDVPARYGGDEFAIILPDTDKAGAMQFATRLQAAAQNSTSEIPVEGKGVSGYTLSIGVASFPQDADSLASFLLAADQAELMAKRLGKNRIVSADDLKK